jgi:hypothetical protein
MGESWLSSCDELGGTAEDLVPVLLDVVGFVVMLSAAVEVFVSSFMQRSWDQALGFYSGNVQELLDDVLVRAQRVLGGVALSLLVLR